MARSLYLSTIAPKTGKVIVSLGLAGLALREGCRVGFFRPVISEGAAADEDIELMRRQFALPQSDEASFSWRMPDLIETVGDQGIAPVLEKIVADFKRLEANCDLIVIEGTDYLGQTLALEFDLNALIAHTLSAPVILIGSATGLAPREAALGLNVAVEGFRAKHARVVGVMLTRVEPEHYAEYSESMMAGFQGEVTCLGVLPESPLLARPTVQEVCEHLGAEVIAGRERISAAVDGCVIGEMYLQNLLNALRPDALVMTSGDRLDLLLGVIEMDRSLCAPRLAGIVLTSGIRPDAGVMRLIEGLHGTLPVMTVASGTYAAVMHLESVHARIDAAHPEKIEKAREIFEHFARLDALIPHVMENDAPIMTPRLFVHGLLQKAREQIRHIVLCEGAEPRVLKAAAALVERRAVRLTLLGDASEVARMMRDTSQSWDSEWISVLDPSNSPKFDAYANELFELRKHKGMTVDQARDMLLDVSYFGTMMVHLGDADGMVSGAVHTTQHTIRPALQIIKTVDDCRVVSSVFFMCLETGVMVYGDCAVNPDPTADELAEIAIRSAETATRFGVIPRVALLSYSTGESGSGTDVEKVREAARLAKARAPDLAIEGPLQYDAAVDETVGKLKLPGSEVAGHANVLIFPDLNTGNNTYKAVQRETGSLAIGPILQGLRRPVNDLSRGCSVEDIVNTVLITAIQSGKDF